MKKVVNAKVLQFVFSEKIHLNYPQLLPETPPQKAKLCNTKDPQNFGTPRHLLHFGVKPQIAVLFCERK